MLSLVSQVCQLTGVYSIHEPHFWTLASNTYQGTIKVEAAMDADSKYILHQVHNIFMTVSVQLPLLRQSIPVGINFTVKSVGLDKSDTIGGVALSVELITYTVLLWI